MRVLLLGLVTLMTGCTKPGPGEELIGTWFQGGDSQYVEMLFTHPNTVTLVRSAQRRLWFPDTAHGEWELRETDSTHHLCTAIAGANLRCSELEIATAKSAGLLVLGGERWFRGTDPTRTAWIDSVTAVLAGSAGGYRGGAGRWGVLGGPGPVPPLRVVWEGPPGRGWPDDDAADIMAVVASAGTVFVPEHGGVYALDGRNGDLLWRFRVPPESRGGMFFTSVPTIDSDMLYFASGREYWALEAATGEEQWHLELQPSEYLLAPTVADGIAYRVMGMVDNDNPQLVAVDARSGIERWRAALGQEDGRERFAGVPVASAGCVFLVSGESGSREPRAVRVHAFDGRTGTERWSVPVSTASDTSMLLGLATDGTYLIYWGGHTLNALDAVTGDVLWREWAYGRGLRTMAVGRGRVYITDGRGQLAAIDVRSATTEWTFLRLQEDLRWPTIVGRHLYVQAMRTESWGSGVYVLDVETGDPIAEYHGDVEFRGPAAIADGRMYVITPNGAVLALSGIDEIDTFR